MNLYGYANGDPINSSDPFGLCPDSLSTKEREECEKAEKEKAAEKSEDDVPSCRSIRFPGTHGTIHVQTSPLGYVQYGIYMNDATNNDGPWTASIWIGKKKEDGFKQTYPPHGSLSSVKARPGEILTIQATHIDMLGRPYKSVPNACRIPLP